MVTNRIERGMALNRRDFIVDVGCLAAGAALGGCAAPRIGETDDYALLQREIDEVKAADFYRYRRDGRIRFDAIERLDRAFDRVVEEAGRTEVTDRPAIWLMYNLGILVKTRESLFTVDFMHPRSVELAPMLDFALITHNHDDHYSEDFLAAMDDAGKTVINNFHCNYGARRNDGQGGYARAEKTFRIKDVEIKTSLTDHNPYLVDFTTVFEVSVGGFRFVHSGDCCNAGKLHPSKSPDLWFVHPYCGLEVESVVERFAPETTVIAHLCELGHDQWRWSWQDGLAAKSRVEKLGASAVVPRWGERIV